MRKLLYPIALLFVLILPCAAYAGYPMKVKDARGKVIVIKSKPMRIVSIAPSNSEILFALGLKNRVVGVTRYCNYPKEAQKKRKIGDMVVSTEAVVSLKPDLILAQATVNDTAIVLLENLGLTVFAINQKTIAQVARDIRTVGMITARPKTAETIAGKIESTIAAVKASRAKKSKKSVLMEVQANPLWAAGPKTFVDEMMHIANAKNIAFDARSGFVPFSNELAISRNPDVIIVGMKSDVDFFLKSPEWRNTNAVKNKRVYVIDHDLMVRTGPRLATGLKKLAEKLDY